MSLQPNREEALAILKEYNESDSLIKHGLSVGGVMAHFARLLGEDEEKWGAIGILHDVDYEKWPEEHCKKAVELLEGKGVAPAYIHAVVSHGYGLCSDVEPVEKMEKVLYTIDELTGLITAAALMRPSKSVMDIELKSVKKKYKDKRFAAGVNRQVIEDGAQMLGMPLDEVTTETILGMREVHDQIGL